MKNTLLINGGDIIAPHGTLTNKKILIENGLIRKIFSADNSLEKFECLELSPDDYILPGMIDMHIHGSSNADVMDANFDALATISQALLAHGTTGFLATTLTDTPEKIEAAIRNVYNYVNKKDKPMGADILGIHLEGPFISAKKCGAHCADQVLAPDIERFERWRKISGNLIKMVTIAPELPNAIEFITYLKQQNIIASIGHTDATSQQTQAAIEAGATQATHLFNAMSGIHHRTPGAATAILLNKDIVAELIVDGIHLAPEIIKLAYQAKGPEQLILVTDAMRAQCMGEGNFTLGNQQVIVKNKTAQLRDGALAGSLLTMSEAINNMQKFTACNLHDIARMTAQNPADQLGLDKQLGMIAEGKIANLAIFDGSNNLKEMILCGELMNH